jgi:hypothetical protein
MPAKVLKQRESLIVPRSLILTRTMTVMLMKMETQMRSTATSQEDQEMLEMIFRREFYTLMTVMSCSRRLASLFPGENQIVWISTLKIPFIGNLPFI